MKKEKKIFLSVGLVLLGLVLMFFAFLFFVYLTNHFEVNGVKFAIDKNAIVGMTLYKTFISVQFIAELLFLEEILGKVQIIIFG